MWAKALSKGNMVLCHAVRAFKAIFTGLFFPWTKVYNGVFGAKMTVGLLEKN